MEYKKPVYLSHIENSLPEKAYGYHTSGYSVALEGWRRGLSLKVKVDRTKKGGNATKFSLSDGNKTHYFHSTRGDLISKEAVIICENKGKTKEYLEKAGVKIPEGKIFNKYKSNDEILTYANEVGYPLVLKPIAAGGGKGVLANIGNETEMKSGISYVREELGYKKVIVERYFQGDDYRFYVVDNKVIAVIKRMPASVTGNGQDTIERLLKDKNAERMQVPAFRQKPIKISSETKEIFQKHGYTMKSIPDKDEMILLTKKNNLSAGGDSIDVTDEVTEELKQMAIDAAQAIPTLVQAGVDMIIDKDNNGVVIEINSRASLRSHIFPSYGPARDVPAAIIDYYFPETINYDKKNSRKIYFDFNSVYDLSQNGSTGYVEIPNLPPNLTLTRLIIRGENFPEDIYDWARSTAVRNEINGYIKRTKKDNILLVLGGDLKNLNNYLRVLKDKLTQKGNSVNIARKPRTTPVMQGFFIMEEENLSLIKEENKNLLEENRILNNEITHFKKENEKMINSTSWKITKTLRNLKRK